MATGPLVLSGPLPDHESRRQLVRPLLIFNYLLIVLSSQLIDLGQLTNLTPNSNINQLVLILATPNTA